VTAPSIAARSRAYRQSQIRMVFDAAARRDNVLSLEIGEPSFATPPHVIEAAARAALGGATHYPPTGGLPGLRARIAEDLSRRYSYSPALENVVVTAGATTGIVSLFGCLLDPGDEVLVPTPGFPNMDEFVKFADGVPVFYRLDRERGYLPSIDDLERARTTRTKVLFLNTPTNPSGSVYPAALMEAIIEWTASRGIWLISDEVYDQILLDEEVEHVPAARYAPADHVISVYSFSKRYAMTGWRIGYCVAPVSIADQLRKLELHGSYTSIVAQTAAEAALAGPQEPFDVMVDAYRRRRDLAWDLSHALGLAAFRPQGAFYMMVDISHAASSSLDFCLRLLDEENVALAPGAVFGPGGEGSVRVSLCAEEATLSEALPRLAHALTRTAVSASA
jgi:aspartate aminotransferase